MCSEPGSKQHRAVGHLLDAYFLLIRTFSTALTSSNRALIPMHPSI